MNKEIWVVTESSLYNDYCVSTIVCGAYWRKEDAIDAAVKQIAKEHGDDESKIRETMADYGKSCSWSNGYQIACTDLA